MNVLVTGGAGYVGSHAAKRLKEAGHSPVIFDSLERGHEAVASILSVPIVVADLADSAVLRDALRKHGIDAVMHFAAYAYVGESVERPLAYYRNNVASTIGLLDAMEQEGVDRFVFSSSCAVYGEPEHLPITESERKAPISPYGFSKFVVERILSDHLRARPAFSYAALRYFNASGCAMDGTLGEDHAPETHLVPLLLDAAMGLGPLTVHGSDYPTPDGTAVRDYVHVDDLAEAHVLAMQLLEPGRSITCNLGTGQGFSVKEMIRATERVTNTTLPVVFGPRRPGDPPVLYADSDHAKRTLAWEPRYKDPEQIIASAWNWRHNRR
jgi:UDP-glucose 4-epimerase